MIINRIEDIKTTLFFSTQKIPLFVGDIHGMYDDLIELLFKIGFKWTEEGLTSNKYELFSVGDLVDRGPNNLKVLDLKLKAVIGNHDWKILRHLYGRVVSIGYGSEITVEELNKVSEETRQEYLLYYLNLPLQLVVNNQYLVVHGGILNEHFNSSVKKATPSCIYGCPTGKENQNGSPERGDWWSEYNLKYHCIYGHTPVKDVKVFGNTINIDTGAVFGNKLTIYSPEENKIYDINTVKPITNLSDTII